MGPLRHADLWHTGIVVDDLEAAKETLGAQLDVTWYSGGAEVRVITDEGATTVNTSYALSKEGPHHVELGQAIPGTLWTAPAPGHAHHVGYWVDDVAGVSDELIRLGSRRLACIALADDAPPMCAYHQTATGLVVEVVTRKMKPMLLPHTRSEP